MNASRLNRRQFLEHSTLAAGILTLASSGVAAESPARVRTAVDQVTLGATGLKLSRLGVGTGSSSGDIQRRLGKDGFNQLIRYAYDQGITFFDTSRTYSTFNMIGDALKGLPREKLFLQSKIPGQPARILDEIDAHRKAFNTDYVDSMLVHCMIKDGWTDDWKRILDGFDEAHQKQWIRSKGVSCHSLPALRSAIASEWTQVHLVRVNPQGVRTDGMEQIVWNNAGGTHDINPVIAELKNMKAKNRGVIGMKIMGNGEFTSDAEREKSVRFAMSRPELDAVVIGFKSTAEIDTAIKMINTALAGAG